MTWSIDLHFKWDNDDLSDFINRVPLGRLTQNRFHAKLIECKNLVFVFRLAQA